MPTNKPRVDDVSERRISMAAENYLLSIFQLEEQGLRITSTQLADQLRRLPAGEGLGTSLASVSGMLGRMAREDLVETTPNKEVVLTVAGRSAAESVVRRHRLAERMVVDLLGLDLDNAHVEAHRLEHAISKDLEDKIRERLGNPTTCPFGHPIPNSGYISPSDAIPLSSAEKGVRLYVDRVPEDDQVLLSYFVANAMIPGSEINIIEAAPYRGILKAICSGNEVVVGYEVAERVWVRGDLT